MTFDSHKRCSSAGLCIHVNIRLSGNVRLSDVPFQPMNPVLNWDIRISKDRWSMETFLLFIIIMKAH